MAIINFYPATSLVGGGENALDGISSVDADGQGAPLATGDRALVITDSQGFRFRYDATSEDAHNPAGGVIAPANVSGPGRWILINKDADFLTSGAVRTVTASGNVLTTDRHLVVDCSGGDIVLSFLSAADPEATELVVERIDLTMNSCHLVAAPAETIAGNSIVAIVLPERHTYTPDGINNFRG